MPCETAEAGNVPDTKTVISGELNMQDAALYSED